MPLLGTPASSFDTVIFTKKMQLSTPKYGFVLSLNNNKQKPFEGDPWILSQGV